MYEGDCEGGTQSKDFFPFPSHFLQKTREKMYFERRGDKKGVGKKAQKEYNQEYWTTFLFFKTLPPSSWYFQLFTSPDLYKILLCCHIQRTRCWFPDSHMHIYLTERTLSLSICLMRAAGDGIARSVHLEASSFLVSQVRRNKTRLPESHAELKGCQEELRNTETEMSDYS